MDSTALLDRSQLTPEERELVDRFASDGGRRPSEDRGATDVEDTRDPGASEAMDAGAGHDGDGGDGDDEGSAFDVDGYGLRNKVGLVLGPLLFAAILLAPNPQGLSPAGQAVGATTAWVATWWITEAIPIPATSLLPIVLFPATGAIDVDATTAPYAYLHLPVYGWVFHRDGDAALGPASPHRAADHQGHRDEPESHHFGLYDRDGIPLDVGL
jgi:sodium-dependent dicarboxylate transporter 2/3/5